MISDFLDFICTIFLYFICQWCSVNLLSFFLVLVILICHLRLSFFLIVINSLFLSVFIHNLLVICFILFSLSLIKIEIFVLVSLFFVVHDRCRIQGYHEGLLDGLEIDKGVVIGHPHCLIFYLLIKQKWNLNHDVKVFQAHRLHSSLFYLLLSH